jgi:NADH:ubiquinone reductase (H+-translocating)
MEAFMSNIQATGSAGYAGLMTALRLGGRRRGLRVALVSARDQFLERV